MKHSMAISKPGFSRLSAQKITRSVALLFSLAFAATGNGMAAEPTPEARVGAYAKHVGNKIAYHYQVTNKSKLDITAISIGYDTKNDADPGNDVWELTEQPSGWNVKFGIPSTSSNAPTGWRVNMTTPGEESKTHAILWETVNDKSPVIRSGQFVAKMSITVDKADINYLKGHALVSFSDGSSASVAVEPPSSAAKGAPPAATTKSPPMNISFPILPLDSSPPTLAVAVSPSTIWSPESRHLPVNVTFAIKEDDFDNLPEIKLESITANAPLEADDIRDASYGLDDRYLRLRAKSNGSADRVYTLVYSATDASGNQSTASATVTVPVAAPAALPQTDGEKGKIMAK